MSSVDLPQPLNYSVWVFIRMIKPKTAETKIAKLIGTGIVHHDTSPPMNSRSVVKVTVKVWCSSDRRELSPVLTGDRFPLPVNTGRVDG